MLHLLSAKCVYLMNWNLGILHRVIVCGCYKCIPVIRELQMRWYYSSQSTGETVWLWCGASGRDVAEDMTFVCPCNCFSDCKMYRPLYTTYRFLSWYARRMGLMPFFVYSTVYVVVGSGLIILTVAKTVIVIIVSEKWTYNCNCLISCLDLGKKR